MAKLLQTIAGLKTSLSFVLHFFAILACYAITVQKGLDTSNVIALIAFSYGGTQTAKQISAHMSASRDVSADTVEAIKEVNDK